MAFTATKDLILPVTVAGRIRSLVAVNAMGQLIQIIAHFSLCANSLLRHRSASATTSLLSQVVMVGQRGGGSTRNNAETNQPGINWSAATPRLHIGRRGASCLSSGVPKSACFGL